MPEARKLLEEAGFSGVELSTVLCPGDLLSLRLSSNYQSGLYRLIYKIYPRWLVRLFGDRWGLYLTITATKPVGAQTSPAAGH